MTADPWTARLSEYVDDELALGEREALERHLPACADCRNTIAELRRVRIRADALADRPPTADLWPGIAARIGVPASTAPGASALRTGRRRAFTFTLPQLAAAGLLVAAVGAGTAWLALTGAAVERAGTPVAIGPDPERLPGPRARLTAVASYDAAIADLQRVLDANRAQLDTSTIRVLEESLRSIDRAIQRAQTALAAQPGDAYLNAHLAETMRRKLELMRRAAALATAAS